VQHVRALRMLLLRLVQRRFPLCRWPDACARAPFAWPPLLASSRSRHCRSRSYACEALLSAALSGRAASSLCRRMVSVRPSFVHPDRHSSTGDFPRDRAYSFGLHP
jgi:hypothetical protein